MAHVWKGFLAALLVTLALIVKISRIGGYDWIDSFHFGSELGNYYTHYLASVTTHIAILVSFSAYKEDFERYNPELEQMIGSQGWSTEAAAGESAPKVGQ